MALIDKETIRKEIERRLIGYDPDYTSAGKELDELIKFLNTLPEQPELKPKAIVIRPVVNLQKELMGVSAEVKDAVMLLLKEGWSLKAPDSEREFDQRAVCAGFSSIPPSYKLDVKPRITNKLFEECLANVDPAIRKEVSDNIDKILGRQPAEGLEEEMEKFFETMPVLEHENIFEDTFQNIARHFAEWQKAKMLEWAKERYQQTISNVGCYTGHSVWAEIIEKLESL